MKTTEGWVFLLPSGKFVGETWRTTHAGKVRGIYEVELDGASVYSDSPDRVKKGFTEQVQAVLEKCVTVSVTCTRVVTISGR